ncbi:hypothetical protein EJB05_52306, partial [Eragrostis curvula]
MVFYNKNWSCCASVFAAFQLILVVFLSTSILLSKHICKILCIFNVYSAVNSRLASVDLWEEIILRHVRHHNVLSAGDSAFDPEFLELLNTATDSLGPVIYAVFEERQNQGAGQSDAAIGALAFGPVDPHAAVVIRELISC